MNSAAVRTEIDTISVFRFLQDRARYAGRKCLEYVLVSCNLVVAQDRIESAADPTAAAGHFLSWGR